MTPPLPRVLIFSRGLGVGGCDICKLHSSLMTACSRHLLQEAFFFGTGSSVAPIPFHPTGLLQKSIPHPHLPDSEGVPLVLPELRMAPVNYRATYYPHNPFPWLSHPSHSGGSHSSIPWPPASGLPIPQAAYSLQDGCLLCNLDLPMSPAALGICHSTGLASRSSQLGPSCSQASCCRGSP